MLLTPSEHSNSSFVRFPQGVFSLFFNQCLDPMLRGLFDCETRPCRGWLTTRILNRVSCSLTNELCSNTYWIGHWEMSRGKEMRRRNNAWHHMVQKPSLRLKNISTSTGWIAITFGTEIQGSYTMYPDYSGDPLTFPLALPIISRSTISYFQ